MSAAHGHDSHGSGGGSHGNDHGSGGGSHGTEKGSSTDYALSSELKKRIAAVAWEELAAHAGTSLGNTRLASSFMTWLRANAGAKGADTLALVLGVIGSGAAQSPRTLATGLARFTGWSEDNLHESMNHGLDRVIVAAAEAARRNHGKLEEPQIRELVREHVVKSVGHEMTHEIHVFANPVDRTFHQGGDGLNTGCPNCVESVTPRRGRDDEEKPPVTKLRSPFMRRTLKWCREQGYQPTRANCCNKRLADDIHHFEHPARTLYDAVRHIHNPALRDKFDRLVAEGGKDKKNLPEAAAYVIWYEDEVARWLTSSTTFKDFSGHLEAKIGPKKTDATDLVKSAITAVMKGECHPKAASIRAGADEMARRTHATTEERRVRLAWLKGHFR